MPKTIILVDMNWLFMNYEYALKDLSVEINGERYFTGVISGFCSFIESVFNQYGKNNLEVIFCKDRKSTKRKQLLPTYKENRKKEQKDHREGRNSNIRIIINILSFIPNCKFVNADGYEADDIIAYLSCKYKQEGVKEIIIYSRDSDLWQLKQLGIKIASKRKAGKFIYVTEMDVIKKYGVESNKVHKIKTLCGDASDNIPPVLEGTRIFKKHYIEFVNLWDSRPFKEVLEEAVLLENKVALEIKKDFKNNIKKINRNIELISLVKYNDLKKYHIDLEFITVYPDIAYIDFFQLSSFKRFINNFYN